VHRLQAPQRLKPPNSDLAHTPSAHAASSTSDPKSPFPTPQSPSTQSQSTNKSNNNNALQLTTSHAGSQSHLQIHETKKASHFSLQFTYVKPPQIIHISSKNDCIPNRPFTSMFNRTPGGSFLLHDTASHDPKPVQVAHATFNQNSRCHSKSKALKHKAFHSQSKT
jgi:hypothetical protein